MEEDLNDAVSEDKKPLKTCPTCDKRVVSRPTITVNKRLGITLVVDCCRQCVNTSFFALRSKEHLVPCISKLCVTIYPLSTPDL